MIIIGNPLPDRSWIRNYMGTNMKSDLVDIAATIKIDRDKSWLLDHGGREPAWVPKSLVEDNGDGTFTMPEWLAQEKGMI